MPLLVLRQLLADSLTLQDYLQGGVPTHNEVARNLFLAERFQDPRRPDYFYTNRRDKVFHGVNSIRSIVIRSFEEIVNRGLDFHGERVIVSSERIHEWQELLTFSPPLPLISYALYSKYGAPSYDRVAVDKYVVGKIVPNASKTAIPSPFTPQLDHLVEQEGLYETHLHLTGTTEVDHVWIHALENPEAFFLEFRKGENNPMVVEQFYQIEPGLDALKVFDRLRLAGRIREDLTGWLYRGRSFSHDHLRRISDLSSLPFSRNDDLTYRRSHPLLTIFPRYHDLPSLTLESLFHVHVFRYFSLDPPSAFVQAYHLYLLLLGFFNKLVVQQLNQVGFDQFQKITVNESRSSSERSYRRRLEQVSGNSGKHVVVLEGRFAPKLTVAKNVEILEKIVSGYAEYQDGHRTRLSLFADVDISHRRRPELRLVAHFIKENDKASHKFGPFPIRVRHHNLRIKLEQQGRALLTLINSSPLARRLVVGIDAASNELHASPEVFAPLFRRLRRNGFANFTYHVGEDFIHLVSGIRAIYEALIFLDLRPGNRIGHGTAIGIQPEIWLRLMREGVVMKKGEWLDDLVFAYTALAQLGGRPPVLLKLQRRIEKLAEECYGAAPTITTMTDAWMMRDLDPCVAGYNHWKPEQRLDLMERAEWSLVSQARRSARAYELFIKYHLGKTRYNMEEYIEVDPDIFANEDILLLQRYVLGELNRREVAIESLPTSNVRIGFYESHTDHHIWRWLDEDTDEPHPTVCLGTDDPGIFATNLLNEYSHLYFQMVANKRLSPDDAMAKIRRLHENSSRYVFRKK